MALYLPRTPPLQPPSRMAGSSPLYRAFGFSPISGLIARRCAMHPWVRRGALATRWGQYPLCLEPQGWDVSTLEDASSHGATHPFPRDRRPCRGEAAEEGVPSGEGVGIAVALSGSVNDRKIKGLHTQKPPGYPTVGFTVPGHPLEWSVVRHYGEPPAQ